MDTNIAFIWGIFTGICFGIPLGLYFPEIAYKIFNKKEVIKNES